MKTSFENFKDDILSVQKDTNFWTGNLSDRWSIGNTPNGGYSMAFAAKAISNSLTHKDPLSISANYLERLDFGESLVKVSPVNESKSMSTARAELIQDNKVKVIFTGTFTNFSKSNGLDLSMRNEPNFDSYDDCILQPFREGFNPKLEKNLEKKYCKDSVWWENSKQENDAVLKLYMSWPEKETVDLFTLILFLFKISNICLILFLFFFKFNPPSVVTSFLFSGTIQTKDGLFLSAILTIFRFEAISKLIGIDLSDERIFKSISLICLLSSLK